MPRNWNLNIRLRRRLWNSSRLYRATWFCFALLQLNVGRASQQPIPAKPYLSVTTEWRSRMEKLIKEIFKQVDILYDILKRIVQVKEENQL